VRFTVELCDHDDTFTTAVARFGGSVSDLVENIYARYVEVLEKALQTSGASDPRAEALCLISLLEGSTIFMGSGRRWETDAVAVRTTVLEFVESRYGEKS
jgi:hypothetical protein